MSSWGTVLTAALIVALILTLVNLFVGSSGLDILLDWVVLGIFAGLTMYDMNTVKMFRSITISQYMFILMLREIVYAVAVGLETMFVSRCVFKKNSNKGIPVIIVLNTIILFIVMRG